MFFISFFLFNGFIISIAKQPIMLCQKSKTSISFGGVTLTKIHRDSKFVFPEKLRYKDYSFQNSSNVCKSFGLEIAEIKHHKDLLLLQKHIEKQDEEFSGDTSTFWIAGTDNEREGDWRNNNGDKLYFTAFWGFSPKGIQTALKSSPANNLQLHWKIDTLTVKKSLVMMDVEADNLLYNQKMFICQFPTGSRCYNDSREEKEFKIYQYVKDELGLLQVINKTEYYVSNVQKNNEEAQSICKLYNYEIIDLSLPSTEAEYLISNISKKMMQEGLSGGVTAFWVGPTDIFSPENKVKWEWTNTEISSRWKDTLFSYKNKFRKGNHRYFGRCLVFGVLKEASKNLYLQFVPCDFRQWVICMKKDKNASSQKGRAIKPKKISNPKFEFDCSSTMVEKNLPYPIPNSGCRQYFRCVEVFPDGIKVFRYKCPTKKLFDPISQNCVQESQPIDKSLCEIFKNSTNPIFSTTIGQNPSTDGFETTSYTEKTSIGTEATLHTTIKTTSVLYSSTNVESTSVASYSTDHPTNFFFSTTEYQQSSTTDEETSDLDSSTTPYPYTEFPCHPNKELKWVHPHYNLTKLAYNSKSVIIEYYHFINNGYIYAENECKNWGLELLEVKTSVELDVIQEYFIENPELIKEDITFWISGSDYMKGNWTYTTGDKGKIQYQAFWGQTSLGYQTMDTDRTQQDKIQLHWASLKEEPFLVMMDVEGEGNFYKKRSIICQYPSATTCNDISQEGLQFIENSKMSNADIHLGQLPDSKLEIIWNKVQKTAKDAVEFCKSHNMQLLNLALSKIDYIAIFDKIIFHQGKHAGFWIGQSNFFQHNPKSSWDWINNIMLDPRKDSVLKFNSKIREGKNPYTGHCLTISIIQNEPKLFYLQNSPCLLPQYTLCLQQPS